MQINKKRQKMPTLLGYWYGAPDSPTGVLGHNSPAHPAGWPPLTRPHRLCQLPVTRSPQSLCHTAAPPTSCSGVPSSSVSLSDSTMGTPIAKISHLQTTRL